MALKSGRVGLSPDQVDVYGRLKPTEWLIDQLRDLLDTEAAEISAQRQAREELARIGLDEPIIQKPIVIEPIVIEPVEETVEEAPVVKKSTRKKVATNGS